MMTLTRYPQVLVSTMGLAFITILVPLSCGIVIAAA
jgi:hypothetical protein